jgi:hypothetical protein
MNNFGLPIRDIAKVARYGLPGKGEKAGPSLKGRSKRSRPAGMFMGDAPRRDSDLIKRTLRDPSPFLHYPAINCRASFIASLRLPASLAVTPYD